METIYKTIDLNTQDMEKQGLFIKIGELFDWAVKIANKKQLYIVNMMLSQKGKDCPIELCGEDNVGKDQLTLHISLNSTPILQDQ